MWSSVPDLHLLAYVFSFCDTKSLLRAEAVCRTWRRAVQLDDRWLRVLKQLPCLRPKHGEEIHFNAINFGALSLKDLYFIMIGAEHREYPKVSSSSLGVLKGYEHFRFHPVRNSNPSSPANIFRLFQCYFLNGEKPFLHLTRSMLHNPTKSKEGATKSQVAASFERLLCRSVSTFCFASGFLSLALMYRFFFSPHKLLAQSYWRGAACALVAVPISAFSACSISRPNAIPLPIFAAFGWLLYFCRGTTTRLPYFRFPIFLGFALLMLAGNRAQLRRFRRLMEWLSLCLLFAFPEASAAPVMYVVLDTAVKRRLEKFVETPHEILRGSIRIKLLD